MPWRSTNKKHFAPEIAFAVAVLLLVSYSGHDRPTQQPHHVGIEGEQRKHQNQGENSWHHQHLDRVEPDGHQGVDFLVDLHGADLGGEGGARATGDDNRGEQDRHLPEDRDADQIDGEDLGTELGQLIGALIGEHHAGQEGDQADDGERIEPGLLHVADQRNAAG